MFFKNEIEGKYINLRCVTVEDADFIVDIRNDKNKNKFVHAVSKDVEKQREWIKEQIERSGDYYFIFSNKAGAAKGLCSIYDINMENQTAEFGRWISWGNALENVESVILAFDCELPE